MSSETPQELRRRGVMNRTVFETLFGDIVLQVEEGFLHQGERMRAVRPRLALYWNGVCVKWTECGTDATMANMMHGAQFVLRVIFKEK